MNGSFFLSNDADSLARFLAELPWLRVVWSRGGTSSGRSGAWTMSKMSGGHSNYPEPLSLSLLCATEELVDKGKTFPDCVTSLCPSFKARHHQEQQNPSNPSFKAGSTVRVLRSQWKRSTLSSTRRVVHSMMERNSSSKLGRAHAGYVRPVVA